MSSWADDGQTSDRAWIYVAVTLATCIPAMSLSLVALFFVVTNKRPHFSPYKILVANFMTYNALSSLVLLLFVPVPHIQRLSVCSAGPASAVFGFRAAHVMLSVEIFLQSIMIASIDLCAVFRFYSSRGMEEEKIMKMWRFRWDVAVGFVYSTVFAVILFFNSLPSQQSIPDGGSRLCSDRWASYEVHPVLAIVGAVLVVIGIAHSAGPNMFFAWKIGRNLALNETNAARFRVVCSFMDAIKVQAFAFYILLLPHVAVFLVMWVTSGFTVNLFVTSDTFFATLLAVVFLMPSINALATLTLIQPVRLQVKAALPCWRGKVFLPGANLPASSAISGKAEPPEAT